jgi:hypothetical protein
MKQKIAARNGLGITEWAGRSAGESSRLLDVPGIVFVGQWHSEAKSIVDQVKACWPEGSVTVAGYPCPGAEDGNLSDHAYAFVRIFTYPEADWLAVIESSLRMILDCGARISWCGGYEVSMAYPLRQRFGGCYAACTLDGGFFCLEDLDEPLRYISDDSEMLDRILSGMN